jgi:hypothetical protein
MPDAAHPDSVKELDEFAAGVTLSQLAMSKPDPLTADYVAQWARGLVEMTAAGRQLIDALYAALEPKYVQFAYRAGFGEVPNAMQNLQMELEDIITEISVPEVNYPALSHEYLEGKDAVGFVVKAFTAFYETIGSPPPKTLQALPGGTVLWTLMQGIAQLNLHTADLGWMIDKLWGPEEPPVDPPAGGGGSPFTLPGEPWHDENPTEPLMVPSGSNPLVYALDEAKKEHAGKTFTEADVIHVYTQPYNGLGLGIGATGWTPLISYAPWWGAALLVLHGQGADQSIIQPNGGGGWGSSWGFEPHPGWTGRMVLVGFKLIASGGNAISGGLYGSQTENPLRELHIVASEFWDGPERCTRPVSLNQASITFHRCKARLPKSKEHFCYSRNPYGPAGMNDCDIDGLGAQPWQEVARPSEGPTYPVDETVITGLVARHYHQDAGRAGSAVTQAGSGRIFRVKDSTFVDVDRSEENPPAWGSGLQSYGCHVTYTGGMDNFRPLPGGFANKGVYYENVDFVHKDPNRTLVTFNSVETVRMTGCGIWGTKGVAVASDPGEGGIVGDLEISGCNTPEARARILAKSAELDLGVTEEHLVESTFRFGSDKNKAETGIAISKGFKVKDTAIVGAFSGTPG